MIRMKTQKRELSLVVGLLIALFPSLSLAVQNQAEPGAKSLFYEPQSGTIISPHEGTRNSKSPPIRKMPLGQPRYVGLRYWIELDGLGSVTADRIFHTGDAIRLHIRSNVDGYMSLWTLDSSGFGKPLFPRPDQPQPDNFIRAGSEYVTPSKIRFAPPAEDERLLVFFSRSANDLPALTGNQTDNEMIAQVQNSLGSKALVFETENKKPTQIGSYIVNRNGGLVLKEIHLKHQ
jgi:hypothetical protein